MKIPLPTDQSSDPTSPIATDPLVEVWLRALESPNGLLIEASQETAVATRLRLYRTRRRQQKAGNKEFDSLLVRLHPQGLIIERAPDLVIKDL